MMMLYWCCGMIVLTTTKFISAQDCAAGNPECSRCIAAEESSPKCSGQGTYRCGTCECTEGHYGNLCQCDVTEATSIDLEAPCKRFNTSDVCENRGECVCGYCACSAISETHPMQKYSGEFCECDNFDCYFFDNQLCGGPLRGQCVCGRCVCNPGYSGTDCGCETSQHMCVARNGEICNGFGICDCGQCRCDQTTHWRGPTCEECPTCPGKCMEFKACVQCRIFGSGSVSVEWCSEHCPHIDITDKAQPTQEEKGIFRCQFIDDDGCPFFFTYHYGIGNRSYVVQAQAKKEFCPEEVQEEQEVLVPTIGVALRVVGGGVVFIGLAVSILL